MTTPPELTKETVKENAKDTPKVEVLSREEAEILAPERYSPAILEAYSKFRKVIDSAKPDPTGLALFAHAKYFATLEKKTRLQYQSSTDFVTIRGMAKGTGRQEKMYHERRGPGRRGG